MHASLLGFGTLALLVASRPLASAVGLRDPFCDGAPVSIWSLSGGVAVLGDMAIKGGVAEKRRRLRSRSASTCGAGEFGLSSALGNRPLVCRRGRSGGARTEIMRSVSSQKVESGESRSGGESVGVERVAGRSGRCCLAMSSDCVAVAGKDVD